MHQHHVSMKTRVRCAFRVGRHIVHAHVYDTQRKITIKALGDISFICLPDPHGAHLQSLGKEENNKEKGHILIDHSLSLQAVSFAVDRIHVAKNVRSSVSVGMCPSPQKRVKDFLLCVMVLLPCIQQSSVPCSDGKGSEKSAIFKQSDTSNTNMAAYTTACSPGDQV